MQRTITYTNFAQVTCPEHGQPWEHGRVQVWPLVHLVYSCGCQETAVIETTKGTNNENKVYRQTSEQVEEGDRSQTGAAGDTG